MNKFEIIHHRGEPQTAETPQGVVVERQEALWVPEWGALVKCAPYDDHFVYANPDTSAESSAYMCTCGSAAVVVPPGPLGLFVCLFHATYGSHTTSFVNLKDFNKVAGQMLDIKPEKARWL